MKIQLKSNSIYVLDLLALETIIKGDTFPFHVLEQNMKSNTILDAFFKMASTAL